jgi:putative hemolysin
MVATPEHKRPFNCITDPSKFLSTVQIGMTFGGIIAAIYGGHPLAEKLSPYLTQLSWKWGSEHSQVLAEGIVSFLIGAITVIFAEIVPKRLALIKPESHSVTFITTHGLGGFYLFTSRDTFKVVVQTSYY